MVRRSRRGGTKRKRTLGRLGQQADRDRERPSQCCKRSAPRSGWCTRCAVLLDIRRVRRAPVARRGPARGAPPRVGAGPGSSSCLELAPPRAWWAPPIEFLPGPVVRISCQGYKPFLLWTRRLCQSGGVHGGCTDDTAREIRHLLNAWSEQNGYDETRCAVNRHAWRYYIACMLAHAVQAQVRWLAEPMAASG